MVPATTDTLKESAYRLRYQVYCLETGFESPEQYPYGLETDEYDACSEHYLIRHRKSGAYAATTRLILPDLNTPERPFPIETRCQIRRSGLLAKIPRNRIAEVSRFCVASDFKRRPGEQGTIAGAETHNWQHPVGVDERRAWPHLTVALIACLHKINVRHGTTHWYSFIEPSFFRLLSLLGIYFTPIGPLTEYHGKRRQPCIIQVPEYLEAVKEKNHEVWDMLTDYGRFWQNSDNNEDAANPPTSSSCLSPEA